MKLYPQGTMPPAQKTALRRFINREEGCGSEINEEEAVKLIEPVDYIILSEDTKRGRVSVDGFVFIREDFSNTDERSNNLYIELICGRTFKIFADLMQQTIALGKELKKKYVSLSALPAVILLYSRKFGFDLLKDCSKKEAKEIAALKEKLIASEIWKHPEKKRNKNNAEMTEDREFQKFLQLLEKADLSTTIHKKRHCNQKKGRFEWDSPNNCIFEGFHMQLCL
jgi:hypothetical protein